jgi:hypothetical protein
MVVNFDPRVEPASLQLPGQNVGQAFLPAAAIPGGFSGNERGPNAGMKSSYVGRVTDQLLGRRLYQHTVDRLNGRWNRFSWFGVYLVNPDATARRILHGQKSAWRFSTRTAKAST